MLGKAQAIPLSLRASRAQSRQAETNNRGPVMSPQDMHADVLHNVRTGVRYHMRRQGFYEQWHRFTGVMTLLLGSAAFVTLLKQHELVAMIATSSVAILQALDLIFETRKRADLHRDLRKRYLTIEPDISACKEIAKEQYCEIKRTIALIEVDEPPLRRAVLAISQNEALEVSGYTREDNPKSFTDLKWYHKLTPNLPIWSPE